MFPFTTLVWFEKVYKKRVFNAPVSWYIITIFKIKTSSQTFISTIFHKSFFNTACSGTYSESLDGMSLVYLKMVFCRVLTDHLVLLKNVSDRHLIFKDRSNTSYTLMHQWDSEEQRFNSIELDTSVTPKQPYLRIKTKNNIPVL